jgi:hypothetical protein
LDAEEEEQRRRADELREQVERLKSGEEGPSEEEGAEPVPESPREFIRRKMREEEAEEEQAELDEEEPAGED